MPDFESLFEGKFKLIDLESSRLSLSACKAFCLASLLAFPLRWFLFMGFLSQLTEPLGGAHSFQSTMHGGLVDPLTAWTALIAGKSPPWLVVCCLFACQIANTIGFIALTWTVLIILHGCGH